MRSPAGWVEPGQTPEFDEFTVVLRGSLARGASRAARWKSMPGQAVIAHRGEWIRYSTPHDEGAEYIAVCLPAFSMATVHRDEHGLTGCESAAMPVDCRAFGIRTFDAHRRFADCPRAPPARRHEFQRASAIQPRGPVHREFHRAAHRQLFLGGEQNSSAADIQRLPAACDWRRLGRLKNLVFQFFPNWKAGRVPGDLICLRSRLPIVLS